MTTEPDVLTAAERFGDALAEAKRESSDGEFTSLLLEANQYLKRELKVDYGDVCSDDGCC